MADREGSKPAGALDQHGVAEPLRVRRGDFLGKVETGIEAVRHFAAGAQRFGLFLASRALNRDAPGTGPDRRAGANMMAVRKRAIEPELLIEAYVLGALGKGEKPALRGPPGVELVDGFGEQRLRDSPVVQIRTDREGSEKADAAPSGGEVRADQVAVECRAEGRDMRRPPAAINIVAVRPEGLRIGRAEERAERDPNDAFAPRGRSRSARGAIAG